MRWILALVLIGSGCTSGGRVPVGDAGLDTSMMRTCENDVDSDGDGLLDDFEGTGDSDGDGTPDYLDTDSDNDGLSDAMEKGDLGNCNAINTDGDAYFDYLDNDSDNDGLSDRDETEVYFTDPTNEDSDGDGFSDTAEIATGHDPLDASDGLADDDFYVVLPFGDPAVEQDFVFGTTVRKADVFFMVDGTGSMTGEISQLKSSLSSIVPEMVSALTDVGVGFGGFAGFGGDAAGTVTDPFLGITLPQDGPDGDEPFHLYSVITTELSQMLTDVMSVDAPYGGATWASSNEALFQAATGDGFEPWLGPQNCVAIPDEEGRRYGYPCFRPGALPIMVVMTDTSSKNGPAGAETYDDSLFTTPRGPHTYMETLNELSRIGARVIGVISGEEVSSPTPIAQFREWATMTGTVDASGAPITFMIGSDGSGLDTSIVEAIRTLAEETPQDITTRTSDGEDIPEQDPAVDATLFIKAITPLEAHDGATLIPESEIPRDDTTFYDVTPGTTVTFRVRFQNDFQAPQLSTQIFLAKIYVVGNGVADLDEHDVVIVVPAGSGPLI